MALQNAAIRASGFAELLAKAREVAGLLALAAGLGAGAAIGIASEGVAFADYRCAEGTPGAYIVYVDTR